MEPEDILAIARMTPAFPSPNGGDAGIRAGICLCRILLSLHEDPVINTFPPPVPASKTLVRPWTLLLLRTGTSHGYDIRQAIIATGYPDPGTGTIYRLLRDLEDAGLVVSHWEQPASKGPARHVYGLTAEGRRQLDDDATAVKQITKAARNFARTYRALTTQTAPG